MDNSAKFAGGPSPSARGLTASRDIFNEQIHRVAQINDNLRQAITALYGPFPTPETTTKLGSTGNQTRSEDLSGLLTDLCILLSETERLSTTVNVGY